MSRIKFQLGSVSGKQAAACVTLAGLLYLVFPASKPAPAKVPDAPAGSVAENDEPKPDAQPVNTEQANSALTPGIESSTSNAIPVRLENQRASIPASMLVGKPYEHLEASDVDVLAAISPFRTPAIDVAIQRNASTVNEATTEPPEERQRRILQGMAAGANVSLVYSSSRGTRATVINREILKPGMTTASGLEVQTIHDEGVRVRLQPGREPGRTVPQEDLERPAGFIPQN